MPRTVGIEEELLVVDPATGVAAPRAAQVRTAHAQQRTPGRHDAADELDRELFRHQVETRTEPSTDLAVLREQLLRARRTAADAARAVGLALVATGTAPLPPVRPRVTPDDRYEDMVTTFGEIARGAGTAGMHVHVQVDSDEQGVAVVDRLTTWLPVVLAVSSNSPYAHGRDTGYASWRSQVWAQWPSAGPTERFGSLERYREVERMLLASGAARDAGMLYFDARLSRDHPTVEVRLTDVCTDVDDALLAAALVRGLVQQAALDAGSADPAGGEGGLVLQRAELVRAAQWRAARYGLSERLVDPTTGELAGARDVLGALVARVRDQLEEAGDTDLVREGVERVLAGTGASRQRAAYARGDGRLEAVVADLAERTTSQAA
ncbi:glutamate--cysteine ligase [Nocardioides perillae]|uniref:Putative glutamate--cysteine ligase 2 n=1 Tax=Nocardioides perillae TaxID=1119534 RepID=A0A7Y9RXV0_9ACTN|nr:carboxylate-amine ligase [Nocardioides perillae]